MAVLILAIMVITSLLWTIAKMRAEARTSDLIQGQEDNRIFRAVADFQELHPEAVESVEDLRNAESTTFLKHGDERVPLLENTVIPKYRVRKKKGALLC
jgi:Flp pilus assembly protein TadB